ncbi:ATP-dependent DNA helicase RecG [Zhihengliuella sp.]|uniref:ATP-dependent DNA helicase RecG n=1 Tax=Zhihengliuella sp. TaxID=1954483 RepID=UPI0028127411|nr:ATP-dependent DNA helicase RecG [Zhihengliuella sp.]
MTAVPVREQPLSALLAAADATRIERELGITTLGDLLDYYPRRYIERGALAPIAELVPGVDASVIGTVVDFRKRRMHQRRGTLYELKVADDPDAAGARVSVVFFNNRAVERLVTGTRLLLSGVPTVRQDGLTLSHPDYEILAPESDDPGVDLRPTPIYGATKTMASDWIRKQIGRLLDDGVLEGLADPLPPESQAAERLLPLRQAYRSIHRPDTLQEAYRAQHRFKYQEAFLLQTVLATRRAAHEALPAVPRPPRSDGVLSAFDAALPFTLTAGQLAAGAEISADLASTSPMNRLLQGEVGSGKTVVALRAILQTVDAGAQAAFLAPTEVLAEQHFRSIRAALGPLGEGGTLTAAEHAIRVDLLTGSTPQASKKRTLLGLASGEVDLVVGTHALLSENVGFVELGMVVVDEQHRFGVEQRDVLRQRAATTPHTLIMTATPIPRTIAMTSFGDLAVSTLTELPRGRQPIRTHVSSLEAHPAWETRLWERAREEIAAGRQVFVVCPLIGGAADRNGGGKARAGSSAGADEGPQPTSAEALTEQLVNEPSLREAVISILHGGLPSDVKDQTMTAFARGEIDLLVSTTVVEVGVDVPNATLMIIMDADRFGVAQLHQLRGRVGRGAHGGTCILVTRLAEDHPSTGRLFKVASTTDGLELSEYDVDTRKEGDILGASQSGGASSLKLLRVTRDQKVIARARDAAFDVIRRDPGLEGYPTLRHIISTMDEDSKAFLERA